MRKKKASRTPDTARTIIQDKIFFSKYHLFHWKSCESALEKSIEKSTQVVHSCAIGQFEKIMLERRYG